MSEPTGSNRQKFAPWLDPAAIPYIEFRNVTKKFGSFTAVGDLSLSIYEREFFALLGPSGCGKTTLMRMVAGFTEPSEGEVWLAGENITDVPPHKRPVNMMFQSYALFPHMNVEKNIAFGLKQEGMAKGEIADRVGEMLSLTKMQDFAKRKPDQLSGGQKQRAALARSLAKQPKVLLLDEPLGALDRKLREETQFELMDLQERLGITFMIVTHDQEEAMTVADRIAVMDHGKLVQISTPRDIYERPGNRYVADFVGDINFIEGMVQKATSDLVTIENDDGLVIECRCEEEAQLGRQVWFAARPEKLHLSRDKPSHAPLNAVEGEVWDIAYLGDMSVYNIRTDSGAILKVSQLNSSRSTETPITWEERVWVSWDRDAGMVLDS
jgi:putrescine transport system ATP-binding protein